MTCRLADIIILKTPQILSPSCHFALFTTIRQNIKPHRADTPQNQQFGRTVCRVMPTCRYHRPKFAKIVAVLLFTRIYGHTEKPLSAPCHAKLEMRQNCLLYPAYLRTPWDCILRRSCSRPAVLPFCCIYGHTAKPFAAPCRYAAKSAMRPNSPPCRADLPIPWAYMIRKNCLCFCRFAVFTALQ